MYQLKLSVAVIIVDGVFPTLREEMYKLRSG